jgi:hypothetical protein
MAISKPVSARPPFVQTRDVLCSGLITYLTVTDNRFADRKLWMVGESYGWWVRVTMLLGVRHCAARGIAVIRGLRCTTLKVHVRDQGLRSFREEG